MANDLSPNLTMMPCDLTRFFHGRATAWGVFEDRFGQVKRRFQIALVGQWDGDTFRLHETFRYDDGEEEERVWNLTPSSDGRSFVGHCADAVGEADGTIAPGIATMRYTFRLKLRDRSIDLAFHDKFYPISAGALLNRTQVTKWGVKVGEVTAFFQRDEDESLAA